VGTADRGYWDSKIESDLAAAGVTTVVIPRTAKSSPARARVEHADDFVATVKWRTGSRGTHLATAPQTRLGVATHRLRGHPGARTWCALDVFAHNLIELIPLQR
jgi:IS5 family transposase